MQRIGSLRLVILIFIFTAACITLVLWPGEDPSNPLAYIFRDPPTVTPSPTPTRTSTQISTQTQTSTFTQTPTPTNTLTPSATPSPAPTGTPTPTQTGTPLPTGTNTPGPVPELLIGAGDIAYCGPYETGDDATASLIERYPQAVVFTAGDNVQHEGEMDEYLACFGPSWGRFKTRIRPSPGNHDYNINNGADYFSYFGEAAGPAGLGYYSYDLGNWHIVSLNSNCGAVDCSSESAQVRWLRQDLANSNKECTLLYWHHPRWTSGEHSGSGDVASFWKVAYEYGAEVIVNGHNHQYERFAPQDDQGNYNPDGIRMFVAGTANLHRYEFGSILPNSEARDRSNLGVLLFRLYPGWYEWEFIPIPGGTFFDSGGDDCH